MKGGYGPSTRCPGGFRGRHLVLLHQYTRKRFPCVFVLFTVLKGIENNQLITWNNTKTQKNGGTENCGVSLVLSLNYLLCYCSVVSLTFVHAIDVRERIVISVGWRFASRMKSIWQRRIRPTNNICSIGIQSNVVLLQAVRGQNPTSLKISLVMPKTWHHFKTCMYRLYTGASLLGGGGGGGHTLRKFLK